MTTLFSPLFIDQKQWRKKKKEREKEHHMNIKEKIV